MKKTVVPSEPRPLPDGPLYFVGIGGAGMSAIAYVLAQRGRAVAGSDPGISVATKARLESVGVTVYRQHDAGQLGDIAALVVTDAVNEQNPEVIGARERAIPVFRRPEALGAIFNAGRGIAIAGTHGKTTTTGMVASILLHAGLSPTILIGGDLPLIGGNSCNGDPTKPGGDIVVAESCEAYDGFLYLHPEIAVITNIEADHLDFHGTEEAVFESFRRFVRQVRPGGKVIICEEDQHAKEVADLFPEVTRTYAVAPPHRNAYYNAIGVELAQARPTFVIEFEDSVEETFTLGVPGLHNVRNALAAAGVAYELGIAPEKIKAGLEAFTGTGRRFERLGEVNGVLVVDDYAHHPTEIAATLSAARSAYPYRRIVPVFQPHLPSRTRDFMDEFASVLSASLPSPLRRGAGGEVGVSSSPPLELGEGTDETFVSSGVRAADTLFLTDIYLAREQPLPGVSSETLAEKVRERNPNLLVHYVPDKNHLPQCLAEAVQSGDVVVTMGAGDIRKAGEGLLKILQESGDVV